MTHRERERQRERERHDATTLSIMVGIIMTLSITVKQGDTCCKTNVSQFSRYAEWHHISGRSAKCYAEFRHAECRGELSPSSAS